jgi:hypothetical protein
LPPGADEFTSFLKSYIAIWAGRPGVLLMEGRTRDAWQIRVSEPPADFVDQMHNNCENPLVIRSKFGTNSAQFGAQKYAFSLCITHSRTLNK